MSHWFGFGAKSNPGPTALAQSDRREFLAFAERLMRPFLACPDGDLLRHMPIDMPENGEALIRGTGPLEGLCRMIAGIAPALELGVFDPKPWQKMLAVAFDPTSEGYLVRPETNQTLVELALLAQAILAAPKALWDGLPEKTRADILAAFHASRQLRAGRTNWLLFPAVIEAALFVLGESWDRMRVEYAIEQHMVWYKGDGFYGDGEFFHADYYNSIIIQPMLLDILDVLSTAMPRLRQHKPVVTERAQRFAEVLERLISPDGSFPPLGRSLCYRSGLFHHLARMALNKRLPETLSPAQVRTALLAVIRRTLQADGTFDKDGWLTIGLNGADRELGERYINTGSLYFASLAFLPLGLAAEDEFWTAPPGVLTQTRLWAQGQAIPRDSAMMDSKAPATRPKP